MELCSYGILLLLRCYRNPERLRVEEARTENLAANRKGLRMTTNRIAY